MATTSRVLIDDDLYASAELVGGALGRSASEQVVHWARIGRELEASASTSQGEIAAVLAGARRYDSLTSQEQAVVRAEWSDRMAARRASLDLASEFRAAGETWAEIDPTGD